MKQNFTGTNSSKIPCESSKLSVELSEFQLNDAISAAILAVCIINGLLSAVAVSANTLVVAVMLRYRELRSNSNILILFLALTDVMVGLIVQPSFIVFSAGKLQMYFNCAALMSYLLTETFCVGLSLLTLSVVTLERYIAIFHPFWYVLNVNKTRLLCVTGTVWTAWMIFNVACRVFSVKNDEFFVPIGSVITGSALFFDIVVYYKIFKVVKHHERRVKNRDDIDTKSSKNWETDKEANTNEDQKMKRNEQERRMTRTVGYILGTLLLCYFPLMLALTIEMMISKDGIFDYFIYPLVETIMFMNSALNPFLYCWRCHDIRKKMLQMLLRQETNKKCNKINAK